MNPSILLFLTAAMEVASGASPVMEMLDRLADVRARMKADNRTDPTDEELDVIRGRIQARQDRIDNA